ncbi:putative DNA-(apurinic or apyrimidinic site) lyase-like isoform X4 [Apostichopus japonicus]|uniref:Putative DNA-(Apurinic or apyrimidinic site) lyase-like isoform X4 n=1 Tax=Stichopus japonicus TaxID=307972 RepID=A0A2G8JGR6_STIJA|nr:putative DNA-(apurinic or apyrimidinic site) lyase-like isoform X4 [Apostichopus japonicus]
MYFLTPVFNGGLWNAVSGALEIKGRAFALFLKSQRQWKAKPLEEDVIDKFQSALNTSGYHPDFILPHGSYLLNCGSPNPETLEKSRACLLDEVQRCQRLGLNRYNFHPGSTCGEIPVDECLDLIGESINTVLNETSQVTIVVENMSCQGNTVGGKFEELKGIIDRVKDKSRIGVCLDTCHAFAAGYDLSTEDGYKKMTDEFDKLVGFHYLKGVHLNDSKGKVGCHLDRHENIGKGFIGLDGFRRLMNDKRFDGIPMILETPPG